MGSSFQFGSILSGSQPTPDEHVRDLGIHEPLRVLLERLGGIKRVSVVGEHTVYVQAGKEVDSIDPKKPKEECERVGRWVLSLMESRDGALAGHVKKRFIATRKSSGSYAREY